MADEKRKDSNCSTRTRNILLRKHWKHSIFSLTDEDAGKLLKAIYSFCTGEPVPAFNDEHLRLITQIILDEMEYGARRHLIQKGVITLPAAVGSLEEQDAGEV